jgi:hypothetical protein
MRGFSPMSHRITIASIMREKRTAFPHMRGGLDDVHERCPEDAGSGMCGHILGIGRPRGLLHAIEWEPSP